MSSNLEIFLKKQKLDKKCQNLKYGTKLSVFLGEGNIYSYFTPKVDKDFPLHYAISPLSNSQFLFAPESARTF